MTVDISWLEPFLDNGRLWGTIFLVPAVSLIIIYYSVQFIYRRYFHPLSQFPGPVTAATSTQWLYKISTTGYAEKVLEDLHAKYNTKVLRIGPNELHISDVQKYKVIYSQSNPFPKYAPFYDAFHVPHSIFAEVDPGLHKERHQMLKPFFARITLLKLESLMHQRATVLMKKLDRLVKSRTPFNLVQAVRCFIFDVSICFNFAASSNLLEENDDSFECSVIRSFDSQSSRHFKNLEWPILKYASKWMPKSLAQAIYPQEKGFTEVIALARKCIAHYEIHKNSTTHPVIFDYLTPLSPDEKLAEAIDMLFAGSETTAASLIIGITHIVLEPDVHRKLVDALSSVHADDNGVLPLQELEKVEYLVACVKESLRVASAIPGRLPRVVPGGLDQPFMVEGKVIPEGAVVSISAYTMNYSEELWGPDSRRFNPDRWLQDGSKNLGHNLCAFSKGRRMCLGQNVASAEITILLAYLFKNFNLSLPSDFKMPEIEHRFVTKVPQYLPFRFEKR